MVAGLFAALAAILASALAVASPNLGPVSDNEPEAPEERSSLRESVDDLRASIRGFVESRIDDAQAAAGLKEPAPDAERPSLTPIEPEGATEPKIEAETEAGDGDCATERSSGEDWAKSVVRCTQHSRADNADSSESNSSSSSVNVQVTSSDDAP